jgi:hypothetical protein
VLLPQDNSLMGTVEFATVYALYFLAAAIAGYRGRSARTGSLAAVCAALAGSLIWLAALLAVFYAFHGMPQQAQVFRAEGNFQDFAASGATDFDVFIIGDLFGAAFFHLLLGPVVAGTLGLAAGSVGKGLARLAGKRPRAA